MTTIHVCYDGGRKAFGIDERDDCAVRALANACAIPYATAHGRFLLLGRKNGRGTKISIMKNAIRSEIGVVQNVARSGTLEKFMRHNSSGAYIVWVSGHYTAVVDGRLWDNAHDPFAWLALKCVRAAWRVR